MVPTGVGRVGLQVGVWVIRNYQRVQFAQYGQGRAGGGAGCVGSHTGYGQSAPGL